MAINVTVMLAIVTGKIIEFQNRKQSNISNHIIPEYQNEYKILLDFSVFGKVSLLFVCVFYQFRKKKNSKNVFAMCIKAM